MNDTHYLSQTGPTAVPADFEFDNRKWYLFPASTKAIAEQLERWVVQQVMRNSETRRPTEGDAVNDPLLWRAYNEWSERTRRDIDRGLYGALSPGWWAMLEGSDRGFAELLYQCVRFKEPDWTRDHVDRIVRNEADYEVMWKLVMELNHPKEPLKGSTDPP